MKCTTYPACTGQYAILKTHDHGTLLGRGKTSQEAITDVLNTYQELKDDAK